VCRAETDDERKHIPDEEGRGVGANANQAEKCTQTEHCPLTKTCWF